jgi:hypothetical protein
MHHSLAVTCCAIQTPPGKLTSADFRASVWDLTQNRSSLEPSLGFAAIAGPPCIVDRVPYVQALGEPKRDPKRLWRTRLDDRPASRPQTGPQKS